MTFSFLALAKDELDQAIAYYEKQRRGLGAEFALEVKTTLRRIVKNPEAWSKLSDQTRLCRLKRFPYGLVYTRESDEITIIAVMHLHRKPGYWKDRI
jgi:plasmid stabilization system protein ParE